MSGAFPETCPVCDGGHPLNGDLSACIVSLAHRCDVTGLVMQSAARELGMSDARFSDLISAAWEEVRARAPAAPPQPAPSPIAAAPQIPQRWWHLWW